MAQNDGISMWDRFPSDDHGGTTSFGHLLSGTDYREEHPGTLPSDQDDGEKGGKSDGQESQTPAKLEVEGLPLPQDP